MKAKAKSKTLWVNGLVVVAALLAMPELLDFLNAMGVSSEVAAKGVALLLAIINIVLRFFTDQPIKLNNKHFKSICLFFLAVPIVACNSNFIQQGYKAGATSKGAYDMVMSSLSDLYDQGVIGEEEKEKTIEMGNLYVKAHNEAIEALAVYQETNNLDSKQRFLLRMEEASAALARLLNYYKQYHLSEIIN